MIKKHRLPSIWILLIFLCFILGCSTSEPEPDGPDIILLDGRGGGVIAYSITHLTNTNQIYLMNADGSGNLQITHLDARPMCPVWSPDASQIAFYNHLSESQWSLYIMNADGSNVRRLTDLLDTFDWIPSWSPDGSRFIFTRTYPDQNFRSEIWTMLADGSDIRRFGNMEGGGGDYSPDGTRIVYHDYNPALDRGTIWVVNSDSSNAVCLTDPGQDNQWPDWSPDGSRIAVESKRDGNSEIYVMNADGSNPRRLTDNPAVDGNPKWSPDGSLIAFLSMRDGHYEIYLMNADGSNQRRITHVSGHAIYPDWKPVGH